MNDPDETLTRHTYDIRRIVKGLFYAYPNVRYIALNAGISGTGEGWENTWYFSGFEDAPYLRELDYYYTWVKDYDISSSVDEEAIFFLHIVSDDYYLDGRKLQVSPDEFIGEEELCFTLNENNEVVNFFDKEHFIVEDDDEK